MRKCGINYNFYFKSTISILDYKDVAKLWREERWFSPYPTGSVKRSRKTQLSKTIFWESICAELDTRNFQSDWSKLRNEANGEYKVRNGAGGETRGVFFPQDLQNVGVQGANKFLIEKVWKKKREGRLVSWRGQDFSTISTVGSTDMVSLKRSLYVTQPSNGSKRFYKRTQHRCVSESISQRRSNSKNKGRLLRCKCTSPTLWDIWSMTNIGITLCHVDEAEL